MREFLCWWKTCDSAGSRVRDVAVGRELSRGLSMPSFSRTHPPYRQSFGTVAKIRSIDLLVSDSFFCAATCFQETPITASSVHSVMRDSRCLAPRLWYPRFDTPVGSAEALTWPNGGWDRARWSQYVRYCLPYPEVDSAGVSSSLDSISNNQFLIWHPSLRTRQSPACQSLPRCLQLPYRNSLRESTLQIPLKPICCPQEVWW